MLPLARLLPPLCLVLQITADEIHSYIGHVASKGQYVCPAYLVGSRWAVCSGKLIHGINIDKLKLRFGSTIFGIEAIQFYNPAGVRLQETSFELDLALLKMDGQTRTEPAQISADYPAEGVAVRGAGAEWTVAAYEDCARSSGLNTGAFCLQGPASALQQGAGLFWEGQLAGLAGQSLVSPRPASAIAPATAWLLDTMAEFIPRQTYHPVG